MSVYDEKPWLSLYDQGQPAEIAREFTDALSMFRASVSRTPDGDIIRYFGARITGRDRDRLGAAPPARAARAPISVYNEKPLLGLSHPGQPAEIALEFTDALSMFRASVSRNPDGDIIRYFGGRITARELDELSDAFAVALAA